jgi:Mn2+/Fe2+ NRAMP family transporter
MSDSGARPPTPPPVPATFGAYVRSFGPGIVVVLTWLGAGDIVDAAVAGGQYGYSLMWALVLALLGRFFFVDMIAKYQLCNERGETVMAGLARMHRFAPAVLLGVTLFFAHFYGSYMIRGVGEATWHLLGGALAPWVWTLVWVAVALALVLRGGYVAVEKIFYVFLGLLSVVFLGVAAFVGPNWGAIGAGVLLFEVPPERGGFSPLLVVVSLVGAVAGSINNLMYPYFLQQKGWVGPAYRRVQRYDLLFGIFVIILLDLAVWVIGAELIHPRGITIASLDDLANLLVLALGRIGAPIFYAGVLAAVATSLIGSAIGYAAMCDDMVQKLRFGPEAPPMPANGDRRVYRAVVWFCLISPLVWSIPALPGFVVLAVTVNAAVVVVLPFLAGALWYITADARFIGRRHRNTRVENLLMGLLVALSLYGAWQAAASLVTRF